MTTERDGLVSSSCTRTADEKRHGAQLHSGRRVWERARRRGAVVAVSSCGCLLLLRHTGILDVCTFLLSRSICTSHHM